MIDDVIKLSVIIPIYNREKVLCETLDSVKRIKSEKIEILLVDDGSTDGSGVICDELEKTDARIKTIHKENGGVSSARNVGIDNACGKYIFFCDSDDKVVPKVIDAAIDILEKDRADLYVFDYVYRNVDTGAIKKQTFDIPKNVMLNKQGIIEYLIKPLVTSAGTGLASSCHKLFSAEVIKKNNVRFEEKVYKGEDWRFVLDFLDVSDTAYYIDKTIYVYNLDGSQKESKYKYSPGYHLLGSPIRKLSLINKYGISCPKKEISSINAMFIADIAFSAKNRCGRKELIEMSKNVFVKRACEVFIKMLKREYHEYEISRRYRLYALLIRLRMFFLLSKVFKGETI